MRTLIRITVPVDAGNSSVKDGTLPQTIAATMEKLKPEAAYFFTDRGVRTGLMVVDLQEVSDIPSIAEPLFMGFNAAVEFIPVMNAEELKRGLAKVAQSV